MFSVISHLIQRLPKPFIPLLPVAVTFLTGLVIWQIAFYIPVHYPQETLAPYPHEKEIAGEAVHRPSIPSTAIAAADKMPHHRVLQ